MHGGAGSSSNLADSPSRSRSSNSSMTTAYSQLDPHAAGDMPSLYQARACATPARGSSGGRSFQAHSSMCLPPAAAPAPPVLERDAAGPDGDGQRPGRGPAGPGRLPEPRVPGPRQRHQRPQLHAQPAPLGWQLGRQGPSASLDAPSGPCASLAHAGPGVFTPALAFLMVKVFSGQGSWGLRSRVGGGEGALCVPRGAPQCRPFCRPSRARPRRWCAYYAPCPCNTAHAACAATSFSLARCRGYPFLPPDICS